MYPAQTWIELLSAELQRGNQHSVDEAATDAPTEPPSEVNVNAEEID